MKKQNRIHTFALSMMMTGLSVMPVWAFSGQIDSDSQLETVTCINHSTGQAVPGTVSGARFDCSALPQNLGDSIGVVLLGPGGETPPCDGDVPIQEAEPNNDIDQAQDLGALQGGCSITVTGQTTVGIGPDPNNPNPGADFDWYTINTSGASQPVFSLPGFNGNWFFAVVDLDTDQQLDVQCSDAGCVILGQPSRIALLLLTEEAAAYTLQFSDGATNAGLQSLSRSTYGRQMGQQLRW